MNPKIKTPCFLITDYDSPVLGYTFNYQSRYQRSGHNDLCIALSIKFGRFHNHPSFNPRVEADPFRHADGLVAVAHTSEHGFEFPSLPTDIILDRN